LLAEYIAAVNAFDVDAIAAAFADDALVNDVHREFWGREAIRRWAARELAGDQVTVAVTEIIDHHGAYDARGPRPPGSCL
jgi:ketosteroid isomerase-like protein